MAVFEWSDRYSVGNSSMDSDHKKLFNILNTILDAMKEGRGDEILAVQLDKLSSYAKHHFEAEEKLMIGISYPGLSDQQQAHRSFMERVADFQAEVAAGHASYVISNVVTTVKDWLKEHILTMDMQYEAYLDKH